MLADVVLEKWLIYLVMQATVSRQFHWAWLEHIETLKPASKVTLFLIQDHSYSNKIILIVPLNLGAILFQNITFHSLTPKICSHIIMQKCIQSIYKRTHSLLQLQTSLKV